MFSGHEPSLEEGACAIAAQQLQVCYSQLSTDHVDGEVLAAACHQFLLLYTTLKATCSHECRWRFTPKFHLFQHLCETASSSHSLSWTYSNEDWGGTLGRMFVRKGGKNGAFTVSNSVLNKFRAQNKIPQF